MEKVEPQNEQKRLAELADKLDAAQKAENDSRGVSCVQNLIIYLRMGDIQSAKAICGNEADKIMNYPDIRKIIQQELFSGGRDKETPPHFKTSQDNLYNKKY